MSRWRVFEPSWWTRCCDWPTGAWALSKIPSSSNSNWPNAQSYPTSFLSSQLYRFNPLFPNILLPCTLQNQRAFCWSEDQGIIWRYLSPSRKLCWRNSVKAYLAPRRSKRRTTMVKSSGKNQFHHPSSHCGRRPLRIVPPFPECTFC